MPTISLCMIVKNEEKFLAQCLASARDIVNDIVIVDTGSTDRTPQIAASFGARVFHHPWENHFSRHRNQSISYARGDWILWLDADEALESGAAPLLMKAIQNHDIDGWLVTMICFFENRTRTSWNNSVKVFKNKPGIRFEGAVHNQVVGLKNTGFCPVKIYHYGYDQDQKTVQKKFERTSALLSKAIQEDPGNFRHYHDLAVSYSSLHFFSKAIDAGRKAMALYRKNREQDPNLLWTYFVVASAYFNLGHSEEARRLAEQALQENPDHLDSIFVLASVYASQADHTRFLEAYQSFERLAWRYRTYPERLAGLVMNKLDEKWRLDLEYGALLLDQGLKTEALLAFAKAFQQTPDQAATYLMAARMSRKKGFPDICEAFLDRALQAGLSPATVHFEKALLKQAVGDEITFHSLITELLRAKEVDMEQETAAGLAGESLKMGEYQKAESLLREVVGRGFENPAVCTSLALALKYQGKVEEALDWNLKALEYQDDYLNALVNLGHIYYEQKDWKQALAYYEKALSINPQQTDVLLRLSLIALIDQNLEICIEFCDRLLKSLHIPCNLEITGIRDIAHVYRLIGETLQLRGQKTLAREALTLAGGLVPTA